MGFVQPGTKGFIAAHGMGVLKTVPSRMFLIVPLGERHIFLSLYSSMRWKFGVIVAHLTPTLSRLTAIAASIVTLSSVSSRCFRPRS